MRSSFVAAFAVSTVVCSALTPLVRRLAHRVGALSQPGGRHVHEHPTPRLGGVAIFIAFFAPLVGLFFVDAPAAQMFTAEPAKVAALFLGSLVMCGVGVIDDTRGLRAIYKLLAQVAVGALAFACGFQIQAVSLPLVGELSMGVFAAPVTVLWIVGLINAVNLIDGLDGLAAGVVFFAAFTNLVVGLVGGADFVCLLMASMLGAVFAFLFFNFNPARIFMGDSGSYFLGYVLAVTSLTGASQKASTTVALLAPVVALGVPIFDTLFTMVRRVLERRPLFSPDRGHIHHRLLDMGLTHRRAVLMLYGVSVVFTGLAIAISIGRSWEAGLAMLAASLVLIGLIKFAGYFEYLKPRARESSRLRSRDGELLRFVLPKAVKSLGEAQSEEELFAALGTIASEAQLDLIDVIEVSGEGTAAKPASVWQRHPKADKLRDDLVSVSFPIGPEQKARAFLCFRWESAAGEVTPQAEILLQVLVDIVAAELTRLRSRLAPEPPAPRLNEHEHEHELRKDEVLRKEDAEAAALMTREERIVRAAR